MKKMNNTFGGFLPQIVFKRVRTIANELIRAQFKSEIEHSSEANLKCWLKMKQILQKLKSPNVVTHDADTVKA
jgi:hypothetical protein